MTTKTKFILFIFIFTLTACSSVVSNHPIGLDNSKIDPKDLDGFWLCNGEILKIKVIDESKGIVKLAWFEDKDNDLKPHSIKLSIMKGKKWIYANIVEFEGKITEDRFYWGRINFDSEKIIFWHPSVTHFADAAESKKIEAIVHKKAPATNGKEVSQEIMPDLVELVGRPEDVVDLVEIENSLYFNWDSPTIFTKIIKSNK